MPLLCHLMCGMCSIFHRASHLLAVVLSGQAQTRTPPTTSALHSTVLLLCDMHSCQGWCLHRAPPMRSPSHPHASYLPKGSFLAPQRCLCQRFRSQSLRQKHITKNSTGAHFRQAVRIFCIREARHLNTSLQSKPLRKGRVRPGNVPTSRSAAVYCMTASIHRGCSCTHQRSRLSNTWRLLPRALCRFTHRASAKIECLSLSVCLDLPQPGIHHHAMATSSSKPGLMPL